MSRYKVMARWHTDPNDPDKMDIVSKDADTRKQVNALVNFLLKEVRPYQISITDKKEGFETPPAREDIQASLMTFTKEANQ